MPTLVVGSSVQVAMTPGQTVNFVSSFGTSFRYTFTTTNPEFVPLQNSSRSYGPAAQNVTVGPFIAHGTLTIYNDVGSALTYNFVSANYEVNIFQSYSALVSYGATTLSPANANVTISPTGTGTVTINPATLGNIDNCRIGATSRGIGLFSLIGINHGDLSGTPGNATMSTPKGRNAIAAGSNNIVITNAVCTATSTVFAVINQASADATLTQIVRVVPAAGSFTIYGNANATANTVVDWLILQS